MALVTVVLAGFVGTVGALVSLLAGFGLYTAATVYFSAAFAVVSVVLLAVCILRIAKRQPGMTAAFSISD